RCQKWSTAMERRFSICRPRPGMMTACCSSTSTSRSGSAISAVTWRCCWTFLHWSRSRNCWLSSSMPRAARPSRRLPMSDSSIPADAVLDAIDGGVLLLDANRRIARWNRWLEIASGKAASGVLGKTLEQVFEDVDLRRLPMAVEAALTSNASTIITHALNPGLLPLQTRSERPLLHDITVTPVGHPPAHGCLVYIADVTMATKREQFLRRRQNARYDAVVARAADVILTVDDAGIIQLANPAAATQFGYSADDLLGRPAAGLFEDPQSWVDLWQGALAGALSGQPAELVIRRSDATVTYMEASASRWPSGTRMFVTAILRDISQRRATEAALRLRET